MQEHRSRNVFWRCASYCYQGVFLQAMRRLLANLALAAVLGVLILPLGVPLQTSGTPVCCLPGGKHHCTERSNGLGFYSKTEACPYASQLLATGLTGLYLNKFEIAGPALAGFCATILACLFHRLISRQLSLRGPPALPL